MLQGRKLLSLILMIAGTYHTANAIEAVPGEYVVKFKNSAQVQTLQGLKRLEFGLQGSVKMLSKELRIAKIERSMLENSISAMAQLQRNANIEYVEPNYIYKTNRTPNDPKLGELWGLINSGQLSGRAGVDINVEKAWDITTGSKDIVVAVIDTGVDYTHPDLQGNIWINEAEKNGRANVDDDGNGVKDDIYGYDAANKDGDPMDDNGHGTHCAGTIGGKGDNGVGVVGVNWDVRIMGIKFLKGNGSGSLSDAVLAIDYARKNGANVMSNSWGGGGFAQSLEESIKKARDAGILFVAAAGNETNDNDASPTYPATYNVDNVVSVAAIDRKGALATFSNWGKTKVHVAAPGVDIWSTIPTGTKYDDFSGTSMATPHVAGLAALILSKEPNLTYTQLRDRIQRSSTPLSALRNKTKFGLINAYNAITNQVAPPDMNDPSNWPLRAYAASTPHPYTNNFTQKYTVSIAGAQKIAVKFSRFQLEEGYDFVTFKDEAGNLLDTWSGTQDGSFSPVANGDTIIIEIKTDVSVTGHGFDISHVAVQ